MLIAKYDLNSKIYFEEFHPPPFDMKRQQSAMFTDRPDLWRKPQRKPKAIPAEQLQLIRVCKCNDSNHCEPSWSEQINNGKEKK